MRYYVLYNPHAGKSTTEDTIRNVASTYDEAEIVDMTKIENYKSFFEGVEDNDVIVICGGDGTLNRFVNDTEGIEIKNKILYHANGTGNDFLKDIAPNSTDAVVEITDYLKDLPTVTINGKATKFINGVGYGIDGYCCEVGDMLRARGKKVNYTGIAIKGLLFHYKPTSARVTVDGKEYFFKRVWIAPTMNGRYYGGGMMPAPEQKRNSGELSLMVWHGSGKLKTLMAFPSLFKGEHLKHEKMIVLLTGKQITVEFDGPRALQIDGETVLGVTKYEASANAPIKINA